MPATQVDIAGSATLNSPRYSRRRFWVKKIHRPSIATVNVAGAGPNIRTEVNTNTSDIDTLAGWPGTLTTNRPAAIVSTVRPTSQTSTGTARIAVIACAMAKTPPTVTMATNAHTLRETALASVAASVRPSGAPARARIDVMRHSRETWSAARATRLQESTTSRGP